jgi:acyl carrier protein
MNTETLSNIQAEVFGIICKHLEVEPDELQPSTSLVDDLNADSMALVTMVVAMEERFGMDVPNDVLRTFKTIGDITAYIETQAKDK